jgi:para-aminobenzoate synthetase component 1
VLRARGLEASIECRRAVRPGFAAGVSASLADPFDVARALLAPLTLRADSTLPPVPPVPFWGGAVGYFGYELASCVEPIALEARDDLALPDLALAFVDRLVAIDHELDRAWAIGLGFSESGSETSGAAEEYAIDASADVYAAACKVPPQPARGALAPPLASEPVGLETGIDARSHSLAVEEIREQIAAGNVYQANLTQRVDLPRPDADPFLLYRELRDLNPAPFAAYLEFPEVAILSSSPERFLALDAEGAVESRPIKGTRPRGATRREDRRLREELQESAKDRAENLMIVDLVRNDLGRVCEIGSVAVPELMSTEAYATVLQLVSAVTGQLRDDRDVFDLVRASFPPGSMTGAPKLAAMRQIDRLEPVRRGVYSGALGYLDVRGGCDLSVVIRTLLVTGEQVHLHVGGGIVADSEPDAEYRESLDKARALLAALDRVVSRSV